MTGCEYPENDGMNEEQAIFYNLGAALAIGLLIGVERGWEKRSAPEGKRIAGIRTYGLIGLLGGGLALLAGRFGPLILGLAFIGLAGALTTVYVMNLRNGNEDIGITSLITGLLTFVLGALAVMGDVVIAVAFAVVTTILLSYKPLLHHWVSVLEPEELRAGLKMLLITVVLLPVLPDKGYGPMQSLNPYEIWWMVVLVAAISFIGYFAIKIAGARQGIVFTSLFGGLSSSTALTLHFSRMLHRNRAMTSMLSMGILLACGTMFPRLVLIASVVNAGLVQLLLVPATVMALLIYVPAIFYWRAGSHKETDVASLLKNPLELKTALGFGLFLALIMLLGKVLQGGFGQSGVLALAAASGIADVDAITLSLSRMSQDQVMSQVAVGGIVIAAAMNNLVKGGIALFVGDRSTGLQVGLPLLASAIGGLLAVWLWVW